MGSTVAVDVHAPLGDLPEEEYVYSTAWKMLTSDIDRGHQLRPDAVTRHFQEVGDEFVDRLATTTDERGLKWRPWLPGPVPPDAESISFALRDNAIDIFDHANNTVYRHAIHEVTAPYPDIAAAPYRAVVTYRRTVALRDTVVIRDRADDDRVR